MLLAASLLALTGLVAIVYGLRGRRTDDHPLCRRCGFDLFGAPAGANVCSECGAGLNAPRAVRIGHRARRRGPIFAGAALLVPSLAVAGALVWVRAKHVDLIRYKPAAWLVSDLHAAAPVRDAALVELRRRFDAHELPAARVDQVSDVALAEQGDLSKPWLVQWGDWLEHARDAGMLSDERWARYTRQAYNLKLAVRPRVRRGDPVVYQLAAQPLRAGQSALEIRWEQDIHVRLSGHPFDFGHKKTENWDYYWKGTTDKDFTSRLPPRPGLMAQLPDGLQSFEIDLAGTYNAKRPGDRNVVQQVRQVTLREAWTLIPADQSTVRPMHRPELAAAMRAAVRASLHASDPSVDGRAVQSDNGRLHINNLPAPLSHRLYWRTGKRDWQATETPISESAGASSTTYLSLDRLPQDVKSVDLLLRPEPSIAANTLDLTTYWDGEILLENVPVEPFQTWMDR